jgi:hypothetical protein
VFALTERAKLQRALIEGTRVDKTFSPICRCPQRVAHIAFRLMRSARVTIGLVDTSDALVATLVHDRVLRAGLVQLSWNGRGRHHQLLPTASYFPDVSFLGLGRTLRLPSPIALDTDRPIIDMATLRRARTDVVRYRFGEPARAALFVNGARVVLTRFAPTTGEIRIAERLLARADPGRVALVAIDPAGNRSRPTVLGSSAAAPQR